MDRNGSIIQCDGEKAGSGIGQFNNLRYLAVDGCGNVLVTEENYHRMAWLSLSLTHLGYITVPGHSLIHPYTMYLDHLSRRLYTSETSGTDGRVLVLSI